MKTDDFAGIFDGRTAQNPRAGCFSTAGIMKMVVGFSLLLALYVFWYENLYCSPEAARRSQCVNHLKEIGIALHNHAQDHGSFPVGSVDNPGLPVDRRLGWMTSLVPYLELPDRFSTIDPRQAWDHPSLNPLRSNVPPLTICPSNRPAMKAQSPPIGYVGIGGLGVDAPSLPVGDPRSGFFNDHRGVRIDEITDGLANTMAVVESTTGSGPWFAGGRHSVRGLDPTRQPYIGVAQQFGSLHREGANVLRADGSVGFVRATVDPKVFEAQSTIAGGEKISEP